MLPFLCSLVGHQYLLKYNTWLSLLVLEPSPTVKSNFAPKFSLTYLITLSAHQLTTELHVTNPSPTDTLTFQALLHTFIHANIALSIVTPLKGITYINKLKPRYLEEVEERKAIDVREPTDYIYKSARGFYQVSWGGGLGTEVHVIGVRVFRLCQT